MCWWSFFYRVVEKQSYLLGHHLFVLETRHLGADSYTYAVAAIGTLLEVLSTGVELPGFPGFQLHLRLIADEEASCGDHLLEEEDEEEEMDEEGEEDIEDEDEEEEMDVDSEEDIEDEDEEGEMDEDSEEDTEEEDEEEGDGGDEVAESDTDEENSAVEIEEGGGAAAFSQHPGTRSDGIGANNTSTSATSAPPDPRRSSRIPSPPVRMAPSWDLDPEILVDLKRMKRFFPFNRSKAKALQSELAVEILPLFCGSRSAASWREPHTEAPGKLAARYRGYDRDLVYGDAMHVNKICGDHHGMGDALLAQEDSFCSGASSSSGRYTVQVACAVLLWVHTSQPSTPSKQELFLKRAQKVATMAAETTVPPV